MVLGFSAIILPSALKTVPPRETEDHVLGTAKNEGEVHCPVSEKRKQQNKVGACCSFQSPYSFQCAVLWIQAHLAEDPGRGKLS